MARTSTPTLGKGGRRRPRVGAGPSDDEILSAYRARDALSGRRISWDGGAGVAKEIDEHGHLVVESPDGERVTLGAGEVHLAVES